MRLELWNGRCLDLSQAPTVTVAIPKPSALLYRARRLEQNRERAIAEAGDKRYRIWQIYLAGCAHGFAREWMNI